MVVHEVAAVVGCSLVPMHACVRLVCAVSAPRLVLEVGRPRRAQAWRAGDCCARLCDLDGVHGVSSRIRMAYPPAPPRAPPPICARVHQLSKFLVCGSRAVSIASTFLRFCLRPMHEKEADRAGHNAHTSMLCVDGDLKIEGVSAGVPASARSSRCALAVANEQEGRPSQQQDAGPATMLRRMPPAARREAPATSSNASSIGVGGPAKKKLEVAEHTTDGPGHDHQDQGTRRQGSLAAKLAELAEANEAGALSGEEFAAVKTRLLEVFIQTGAVTSAATSAAPVRKRGEREMRRASSAAALRKLDSSNSLLFLAKHMDDNIAEAVQSEATSSGEHRFSIKDSFIGTRSLGKLRRDKTTGTTCLSVSKKHAQGKRKECPTCEFRWLDKYDKNECPKCLFTLADKLTRSQALAAVASGGGDNSATGMLVATAAPVDRTSYHAEMRKFNAPQSPLKKGERRRQCPTCLHRWLDRNGKDECPRCLQPMSSGWALLQAAEQLGAASAQRRVPGETSTIKFRPSSAMESSRGDCKAGGTHLFRFGKCSKCQLEEGLCIEMSTLLATTLGSARKTRSQVKFFPFVKSGAGAWH